LAGERPNQAMKKRLPLAKLESMPDGPADYPA
jgi:hypothetical protein